MFSSKSGKASSHGAKRLGFESLEHRVVMSATALTPETPATETYVAPPVAAIISVEEWVQSLNHTQFNLLTPSQVPLITTEQIAAIPHSIYLEQMSTAARAALIATQIRALNVEAVGIDLLTAQQISYLTAAQIRTLGPQDFRFLSAAQTPYLTVGQIESIEEYAQFAYLSVAARAALTKAQVQALDVATVRINQLTSAQVSWLTVSQLQSLAYYDFQFLNQYQIPSLTAGQFASINSYYLGLMSQSARDAITVLQVRSLDVKEVQIRILNPQQISYLTAAQLRSLKASDIPQLNASQIPALTSAQFAAISSVQTLYALTDEAQAAISREQLLSLPPYVMTTFTNNFLLPPAHYIPAIDDVVGPDGVSTSKHAEAEAARAFALVPYSGVTHAAIISGNWSNPAIWQGGKVPSAGAKVLIPNGITIRFDAIMDFSLSTLRIDGHLRFAETFSTRLKADTIVVYTTGALTIGTEAAPIHDNVTATIMIADAGDIDRSWDPYGLSRGLISRGSVEMHGSAVTPYVALSVAPQAGDTELRLTSVPTNWRVGDEIVITGVDPSAPDYGADRVRILAIDGAVATVEALKYSHRPPQGILTSVHAANLRRNVILISEHGGNASVRPHLMFMHNPNVSLTAIGVYGFGRTDKSIPINDPIVINGVLQAGTGLNPRARYAIHFHHTGVNPAYDPAIVKDSVVVGSDGWGYVNHSSNVQMTNNVALEVYGSSFVTEDGNEIGIMQGNLSINTGGSDDDRTARKELHDFGFRGHGFWLQGPGVGMIGNIAAGSRDAAYFIMTTSSKNLFDAINIDDPALAAGRDAIPVSMVPLAKFFSNTAYASKKGLEIWNHLAEVHDATTYIDYFTAWNVRFDGVDIHYSGNITLRNVKLVGTWYNPSGAGVNVNWASHDVNVQNFWIENFQIGIRAPVRGNSFISNGYLSAVQGIYIAKGQTTERKVDIYGSITFATVSAAQLRDQIQYRIYLIMPPLNEFNAHYSRLFDADDIRIALSDDVERRLYFVEQLPGYVPLLSNGALSYIPNQYIGKTNIELWMNYGIAAGGGMYPAGMQAPPGYHAFSSPRW